MLDAGRRHRSSIAEIGPMACGQAVRGKVGPALWVFVKPSQDVLVAGNGIRHGPQTNNSVDAGAHLGYQLKSRPCVNGGRAMGRNIGIQRCQQG